MDYNEWAQEYFTQAEKIQEKIEKLKALNSSNAESMNSMINSYKYIYYELIGTAKLLKEKEKRINAKNKASV